MELWAILQIAKKFSNLGWSVQEQMETLLDGESEAEDIANLNPNAVRMIVDFFEDIKDYAEQQGNEVLVRQVDRLFERINDVFYTGEGNG